MKNYNQIVMPILVSCMVAFFVLIVPGNGFGQGWAKAFGDTILDEVNYGMELTADGGAIICGYSSEVAGFNGFLTKTDVNGMVQWSILYQDSLVFESFFWDVQPTLDGGYIAVGHADLSAQPNSKLLLFKTDAFGNEVWTTLLDLGGEHVFESILMTADSGFVIVGGVEYSATIMKFNATGDSLWSATLPISINEYFEDVTYTSDGGFMAVGHSYPAVDTSRFLQAKFDSSGNYLWHKILENDWKWMEGKAIAPTFDGGHIITGKEADSSLFHSRAYLMKTDPVGDTIWIKRFRDTDFTQGWSVIQTADSGFAMIGTSPKDSLHAPAKTYIVKTDASGATLWFNYFDEFTSTWPTKIHQVNDGGYLIGASVYLSYTNQWDNYLIKTNGNGEYYTSILSGNVFIDMNSDCIKDSSESPRANQLIKVEPGPLYEYTDANGYYEVNVDTGQFTVSLIQNNPYWDITCPNPTSFTVNIDTFYSGKDSLDFGMKPGILCPLMKVSVSTGLVRRCRIAQYQVNYWNEGTIPGHNTTVALKLNNLLQVDTASIPWEQPQNGDTYYFNIGTVMPEEQGSFSIRVLVDCNSILGQASCVEARIFPDTLCLPTDTLWDGSSVAVSGQCMNHDSIEFKIRNIGQGNMETPGSYIVMEDNIMGQPVSFQLSSGDSIPVYRPANGSTWRLEATQNPGHPILSSPSSTVEACGVNGGGTFSVGYVTTMPHDDKHYAVDIDCQEVIGSWDPNDKKGTPKGVDAPKYIEETDELEYKIRFQNTGTDTAFLVVIRDTLAPELDVSTVVSGASSHAYDFRIYGQSILEWSFDNILLPDSNVNEPESNGFVKFKVKQTPGNPGGTRIENRAAIWFDFNAPVITNTEFHTIGEDFLQVAAVYVSEAYSPLKIEVYPNPFTDYTVIELKGTPPDHYDLEIFDTSGNQVKAQSVKQGNRFVIRAGSLSKGMYFFRIRDHQQLISEGKLIIL